MLIRHCPVVARHVEASYVCHVIYYPSNGHEFLNSAMSKYSLISSSTTPATSRQHSVYLAKRPGMLERA